jgi:outer membrane protein assembly factor BamA
MNTIISLRGRMTTILFSLFLLQGTLSAQQEPLVMEEQEVGNFKFIPLPILGANPSLGWMFGVAPSASWFMGNPETTTISSALGSVIYTTNQQFITTAKANTFFHDDGYNMLTDIRFFITSQPTYGLGTGPQSAKPISQDSSELSDNPYTPIKTDMMMEFNYLRIHNTIMKRIQDTRFYAGVGYHLDYHFKIKDNLLDLEADPPVITSHYVYSDSLGFDPYGYVLSGISLNALYDSRDNIVNPYAGRFAFISLRINPKFLGSDQGSSILWVEYRDYINLNKERPRHLVGFWIYGSFMTSGTLPYMDLPALGWDQFGRSGRAYTQGRFRGEDLIYNEIEYRFPLQRKKEFLGAVVFINGTTATSRHTGIDLYEYYDIGYGLGLRIMIDKKSRANLNIDYAFGNYGAQGFYLGINEVF